LSHNASHSRFGEFNAQCSWDSYGTTLLVMPKDSMAASLPNLDPAIFVEFLDHLSHFHYDPTVVMTSENLES
jgi:hypothetical protein